MIEAIKPIEMLKVADLEINPVWQYLNRDGVGDTFVRALNKLPVKNLAGKIIGTKVQLANSNQIWALLGNIDVENPRLTEHFITLSVERANKWFALARYHDFDYVERGPEALSRFLGKSVDEIFPIAYDIRSYVRCDSAALIGKIRKEPRERLSRAQIISLAVP